MAPSNKAARRLAIVVGIFVFAVDIATKEAVFRSFELHESISLTPFFNIGYWLNPGAAFSFLSDASGWQRYFFSAVAIVAIIWLSAAILFTTSLTKQTGIAFALIAAGAAGNLYDRVSRGAVIDWIDLHWAGWHWPAFNLADCGIVLGAALLVFGPFSREGNSTN